MGLTDKKHWRFITATNRGNRQWEVGEFSPRTWQKWGKTSKYGRNYKNPGVNGEWRAEKPATAFIDKSYLEELGNEGIFYVQATKVSSGWIEGLVHYPNGLEPTTYLVRFRASDIVPNGPELEIFLSHKEALSKLRHSARFFLGDETFLLNANGRPYEEEFVPGSYVALSLNYELTVRENEPVFYVSPYSNKIMQKGENFFVKLSDWQTLDEAITQERAAVVADFLSSTIGAQVSVKSWSSNGDTTFSIPWFTVIGSKASGFLDGYTAKPFFTIDQAKKHIEELKDRATREKFPFSTANLEAKAGKEYSHSNSGAEYQINFANLMEFAKLAGIEVKLKKFFEDKRGAVASKKFAF